MSLPLNDAMRPIQEKVDLIIGSGWSAHGTRKWTSNYERMEEEEIKSYLFG